MTRAIRKMRRYSKVILLGSVAGNTSTAVGATHSLGNIDVGSASGSKDIILGITWSSQSARTISSLTVGGVSLSVQITVHDPGVDDCDAAIWTGDISGKTGLQAISVTFDASTQSAAVSGVAVSTLQSLTPDNSDGDDSTVNLVITNLAALFGGIAFAVAGSTSHSTSATWGSLTEKADVSTGNDVDNDHVHTSAWDLGFRAAASETIDFGAGGATAAVGAGFR